MKKIIFVSNLLTMFLLCYYAVAKGMDVVIGITLSISIISNVLNIICEVKYAKREKD